MSENNAVRLSEVIVFAGPNGSGKSTITQMAKVRGEYINADDIKKNYLVYGAGSGSEGGRIAGIHDTE